MDAYFCKFCGKPLDEDSVFCSRCGKRVKKEEIKPEEREDAAQEGTTPTWLPPIRKAEKAPATEENPESGAVDPPTSESVPVWRPSYRKDEKPPVTEKMPEKAPESAGEEAIQKWATPAWLPPIRKGTNPPVMEEIPREEKPLTAGNKTTSDEVPAWIPPIRMGKEAPVVETQVWIPPVQTPIPNNRPKIPPIRETNKSATTRESEKINHDPYYDDVVPEDDKELREKRKIDMPTLLKVAGIAVGAIGISIAIIYWIS